MVGDGEKSLGWRRDQPPTIGDIDADRKYATLRSTFPKLAARTEMDHRDLASQLHLGHRLLLAIWLQPRPTDRFDIRHPFVGVLGHLAPWGLATAVSCWFALTQMRDHPLDLDATDKQTEATDA